MAPRTRSVVELPRFDTGRYEGCEFLMTGGDAKLIIRLAETEKFPMTIHFDRVRWHLYTALYNCTSDQIEAYFKVVEVIESTELAAYVRADLAPQKAYRELHHYRIFLDETGCHELYAQSCHVL